MGEDSAGGAMIASLNPRVDYRSGSLFCEEVPLRSVAERYGTPVYVYSQAAIRENFKGFQKDLGRLPSLICYSVKANSNLSILTLLREAGAGFDVVSGGELARALKVRGDPSRIVFSGVGKTQPEVDAALHADILMFNVESAGELELIGSRAQALGRRARVSIRVNPEVEASTHPYISTGQTIHKFGVPKAEALALYRLAGGADHFETAGIACHIGSQILDEDPFIEAFEEIKGLADELRAEGVVLQWIDLGGGFGIRYADEDPLNFSSLARELEARLRETPYRLVVEPGRSIVGNAGLLLTRALYVKHNERKNFIVVDSGMNDLLRPTLYGSFHEIVPLRQPVNGQMRADVVGPICETGDFLAQDRDVAVVAPGDILAVLTCGAYGYVLASNYNTRPRPAEVMIRGDSATLIRERETVEDLMRGEKL
jgi:diaminopimelate decarboxylase